MHSREELETWLARTRRTQRQLNLVIGAGAAIGVALLLWLGAAGALVLLCVGFVAICGYWITNSHLADWERELDELDRPQPAASGERTGRYQKD